MRLHPTDAEWAEALSDLLTLYGSFTWPELTARARYIAAFRRHRELSQATIPFDLSGFERQRAELAAVAAVIDGYTEPLRVSSVRLPSSRELRLGDISPSTPGPRARRPAKPHQEHP